MAETTFKRCIGMSYDVLTESGERETCVVVCDRRAPKFSPQCKRHRTIELVIGCEWITPPQPAAQPGGGR